MSSQNEAEMEYKLNEVRPGEFEVVRSIPVVMGTFTDHDIARKFMLFLAEEEIDAQQETGKPAANADEKPADVETVAPQIESTQNADPASEPKVHRAPYAPVKKSPEERPTVNPAPSAASDEPWTEGELKTAFEMLSKGEALRVVADRHGKSWTKLRGVWAVYKKHEASKEAARALVPVAEPGKTPLEKVTSAVSDLAAQEECRICKRHFTPTTDNLDLCARCNHGA